jgi:ATP-dependent DNA helicase RecQ
VPSLRRPSLVSDLARRVGLALGLPFHAVLGRTEDRPEQQTMANSTYQARNLDGALAVVAPPSPGPVLLIDDMVDSRWTLTVSAWLLRSNGSGAVWPLALALSGGGE